MNISKQDLINSDGDVNLNCKNLREFPKLPKPYSHVLKGTIYCMGNALSTWKNFPKIVYGHIDAANNSFMNFIGMPTELRKHGLSVNEFSYLDCSCNRITSLEGIATHIHGSLLLYDNFITDLEGIERCEYIGGDLLLFDNDIKHGLLKLLKIHITGNIHLTDKVVSSILNARKNKGRAGVMMAVRELIDNGYEDML